MFLLDINVLKTKEMIIDFRKNSTVISPVVINDHVVEVVHQLKSLGTVIDEKLTFEAHVDAVGKRAHISVCSICESFVVLQWTVLSLRCFTLVVLNLSLLSQLCVGMGHLMLKTETDCKVLLKCVVRLLAPL